MTLVELLVGLAIGLFIVVSALALAVSQLQANRTLIQESRLTIGLGAAADVITRDLRRAGYREDAGIGIFQSDEIPVANPYDIVSWSTVDSTLLMTFSRDLNNKQIVDTTERFAYRLRAGTIDMKIGGGVWQAVTDSGSMTVTAFSLTPVIQDIALGTFCEQPCPPTTAGCPHQLIRRFDLTLAARSPNDATIAHDIKTSIRMRNDVVSGACPA